MTAFAAILAVFTAAAAGPRLGQCCLALALRRQSCSAAAERLPAEQRSDERQDNQEAGHAITPSRLKSRSAAERGKEELHDAEKLIGPGAVCRFDDGPIHDRRNGTQLIEPSLFPPSGFEFTLRV